MFRNPKRELFESSEGDRNEIRMVHEDRLNNSFLEEINSIVLQEGTLRTTAQNQALLKNNQCDINIKTLQSPSPSIVELVEHDEENNMDEIGFSKSLTPRDLQSFQLVKSKPDRMNVDR